MPAPKSEDFRKELWKQFDKAQSQGASWVDINSGKLHRAVGGYPGDNHRMPVCCDVMYEEQREEDGILSQPPKGKGARLTIRYELPR